MEAFFLVMGATTASLLAGAGVLHLIGLLGKPGRAVIDVFCRAPWVDWVVTYFVAAPMI